MRPRDCAKFLGSRNPHEPAELAQIILIGFARIGIAEIGKPFDFWRDIGECVELCGRQRPPLPFHYHNFIHRPYLLPDTNLTPDKPLYEGCPASLRAAP